MVTTEDVSVSSSTMPGTSAVIHSNLDQKVSEKKPENRRSNKPIMEKRRRARINNCLNELKGLILEATKRDPARHSKLEKADILEMTVRYLQDNKNKEQAASSDPIGATHFKAGFTVCANAVSKFPGLEPSAKRTLLHHISNCWNQQPIQIIPSSNEVQQNPRILLTNNTSIQIVPNSNGEIFLLPTSQTAQNLPLLVPIPQRTASTCSSTSSSRSESPQEMEDSPKPLALVIRREEDNKKEVWRPF